MVELIAGHHVHEPLDPYMLCTDCGELRISDIVDIPNSEAGAFDAFMKQQAPDASLDRVPMMRGRLVSLQSGSRDASRVEFNLAGARLRFEVRCAGGVPVATPD